MHFGDDKAQMAGLVMGMGEIASGSEELS